MFGYPYFIGYNPRRPRPSLRASVARWTPAMSTSKRMARTLGISTLDPPRDQSQRSLRFFPPAILHASRNAYEPADKVRGLDDPRWPRPVRTAQEVDAMMCHRRDAHAAALQSPATAEFALTCALKARSYAKICLANSTIYGCRATIS